MCLHEPPARDRVSVLRELPAGPVLSRELCLGIYVLTMTVRAPGPDRQAPRAAAGCQECGLVSRRGLAGRGTAWVVACPGGQRPVLAELGNAACTPTCPRPSESATQHKLRASSACLSRRGSRCRRSGWEDADLGAACWDSARAPGAAGWPGAGRSGLPAHVARQTRHRCTVLSMAPHVRGCVGSPSSTR